ncbi:uncharacterized protein METZ01_LOCUS123327 [marine metagenome]|uniref:Uncharacterized protein n=1 Tax=marine metagenome TaxID=408172 RepID=A0A381Y1W3_9ZZZZ
MSCQTSQNQHNPIRRSLMPYRIMAD